jgi:cytoskeletal protein CcmA (bactofilin family)
MNASIVLAWMSLTAVSLLVFLLPFMPCLQEWRRPTDLAALPIGRDEVNDVRYFADAFSAKVGQTLAAGDGAAVDSPSFRRLSGPADSFPWAHVQEPVVVDGPLLVRGVLTCPKPVYAGGNALLQGGAQLPALLCKGNAVLGPGSTIREWVHADGYLFLGAQSILLHRVTAGDVLVLDKGAGFCRMHAPVIHFGMSGDTAAQPLPNARSLPSALTTLRVAMCCAGHYRASGDLSMPAGHCLDGALIASGTILLDDGAAVLGTVKAGKQVRLGRGVQVYGALVCEGDIEIGPDCWIKGPVVCEGDVRIGRGTRIGTRSTPTTLAASRVMAEAGATAHGTVWARNAGVVAT